MAAGCQMWRPPCLTIPFEDVQWINGECKKKGVKHRETEVCCHHLVSDANWMKYQNAKWSHDFSSNIC